MNMPADVARCAGIDRAPCRACRRREPGDARWQVHIAPPPVARWITTGHGLRCPLHLPLHIAADTDTAAVGGSDFGEVA